VSRLALGRPELHGGPLPSARASLRVGVDVGGTFTKAVALDSRELRLHAQAVVPTTHAASTGVTQGVVAALERLLAELGDGRRAIELVAFSTTQAMNALLEGDVAPVGVIGIGAAPDLRPARRRTKVGEIALAPGRALHTEHEFLNATHGLDAATVDAALERLIARGCRAIAASGAFAVDAPQHEIEVSERAARLGLPVCAGHELTGSYGLETRTVSAAINAAILPVVEDTATLVRRGLEDAGVEAPLLILRGDGGAMGADAFRRRPSFTVGSGPAAGVAAALHGAQVADGIVIECGGTSTNVSVIKRGRPVLRTIKVMGRPTAIRSIDSWVVGAAGGSMPLLGRRRVTETGPRSAHLAGLPYAAFADPTELAGDLALELIAPSPGDPESYAVISTGERRYALTATCAANALGLVASGSYASGSRQAALAAFGPLAARLRMRGPEQAARAVLDGAIRKIALAVDAAVRAHELNEDTPLVALGGAAEALVPELARRLGRPVMRPPDAEVLSSIGAATSLLRTEVVRAPNGPTRPGLGGARGRGLEITREAERACVEAGAAPETVAVETAYDPDTGVLRAVATGAVALETGAARRHPVAREQRRAVAADALGVELDELELQTEAEFYSVYSTANHGPRGNAAIVDALGGVPLVEPSAIVVSGESAGFLESLRTAVIERSLSLGVTTMLPRVTLLVGARLLDLSDARRREDILATARDALSDHAGRAVAVVAR
jgi:N-methylhydantoinase A/oxoprolinase/acetone carboxylase beta subunit